MTQLTINITQDILVRSKMCGREEIEDNISVGSKCAIALAVREIFPFAHVGYYDIFPFRNHENDDNESIELPEVARKFIKAFDSLPPICRVKMPQFSFTVEVPDAVIEKMEFPQLEELFKATARKLETV